MPSLPVKRNSVEMSENIVLRSLPVDVTLKDIQDCLGYSRALAIEFHQDETGQFKGTVFVKLASALEADKLVHNGCVLRGKPIKVEVSRSTLTHRKSMGRSPVHNKSDRVVAIIDRFIHGKQQETYLPEDLTPEERLHAHSYAEKNRLAHATKAPDGLPMETTKDRCVYLCKSRSILHAPPGLPAPKRLSADAPVFAPRASLVSEEPVPQWLQEKKRNSSILRINAAAFKSS